ncbi:sorting nexin-20 [Exaiptasia diaphana]|uniref:PX domain-containing protein n=1 Tax=Exaiptasia diaphana TaxID=2652724 RepID=A0A913Y5U0_EXADI|nr:sorting nexin-20 [Exaiptasia diaphana]KXJ22125.1 Sorting nexin-21 [Exaiptasia diaphana]
MSLKLLDKLSPPCDSDDLRRVVCDDELDSLPHSMGFNGRLVMINENGYHSLQRQKGEVVFEEEDESSDKEELLFPVDSISRGYSISSYTDQRQQLRFEVVSTRICEEGNKKHVVYTMVVVKTEELDNDKAIVERRYSDFIKLYKELKKIAPELLSKVQMPKKVIGKRNFDSEVIQERSRDFEKFLGFVYSTDVVRRANAFKEFFYFPDLKRACSHIRGGRFVDSLRLLLNALHLQQKLGDGTKEIVATLGSIVVAYENTGHYKEAEQYAAAALDLVKHNVNSAYLIPLLSTRAEMCWRIGKAKEDIEQQLNQVQKVSGIEVENACTLRELAVNRYEENYE